MSRSAVNVLNSPSGEHGLQLLEPLSMPWTGRVHQGPTWLGTNWSFEMEGPDDGWHDMMTLNIVKYERGSVIVKYQIKQHLRFHWAPTCALTWNQWSSAREVWGGGYVAEKSNSTFYLIPFHIVWITWHSMYLINRGGSWLVKNWGIFMINSKASNNLSFFQESPHLNSPLSYFPCIKRVMSLA